MMCGRANQWIVEVAAASAVSPKVANCLPPRWIPSRCTMAKASASTNPASEAITTMVVDWLPAGAVAGAQARPEPDPWLEGCRRDDQRAVMSRFKRVLLTALAEQGVEQPIPSKVGVKTSDAPIGEEVLTGSFDAPVVRMVDQRMKFAIR